MNKHIVKFLEFKGKNIVYLSANGRYWIAIKPVCEVLCVDYIRQYKNFTTCIVIFDNAGSRRYSIKKIRLFT